MDNHILRPALGYVTSIGTLYDAKRDSFLNQSLLNRDVPPGVVSVQEEKNVNVRLSYGESYAENFKAMNVGPDLAASLLSGLVQLDGVGRHLIQKPESSRILQAFIYHTIIAAEEKLDLRNTEIGKCISPTPLQTSAVTHVVTEIEYGAQTVLMVNRWLRQDAKTEQERAKFQQQVDAFVGAIRNGGPPKPYASGADFDQISTCSTTLGNEDIVLNDSDEAQRFFELVPLQIRSENAGRGKPILYKLLPIHVLGYLNLVQIELDIRPNPPSHGCMKKFIQLCDEFRTLEGPLLEYKAFASKYKFCLPPNHLDDIVERVHRMKTTEQELRRDFARTLQDVRRGMNEPDMLWQLINDYSQESRSPKAISTFAEDYQGKVAFIDSMLSQGATYFEYNSAGLRSQLAQRRNVDFYIFLFNESARQDPDTWNANQALMLSLLSDRKKNTFFAIVDCDATQSPLKKAVISHYRNGKEVVRDLYEEQQYLAEHSFARYRPQTLETNIQRPTKRRLVKIPCPGGSCTAGNICEWWCLECHAPLEYGYSDQYIYCECGRSLYSNFAFKCNSSTHGPGFDRYNNTNLLNFLKSLDQSDYLNILILGETGVGKSTFINAFVNYLYFSTLDDALNADGLQWVIPCSFSIQTMDRSSDSGEIKETRIKVGDRDDERDGSRGDSATQQTQVYPICVGGVTYRLIDTPGIGDTRGLNHDKKNMADILATVSGYDYLHGILILLKSNDARLTAHFSFCVKELLTHLHRDATNNVVFGFTNTRISNYMPGDTFGSLKTLLSERSDIGLSLSAKTSYCFDSESFRYLAAFKNEVIMDNKSDFDRSWEKSRSEAVRMLEHFRAKEPHPIKSTISLNGTRNLILELTKPMADISQCIKTNIAVLEDDVRLLQDARLTGDKLRQKLNPEMWLLRKKTTTMPRTVCQEQGCVEFKDDGSGKTMIAEYPKPCHPVCYLTTVRKEVKAHGELLHCAAFSGNETCQQCGHHWTYHLHILYEIEKYKTRIKDLTVEQQIKQHASDVALKQAAIEDRKKLMEEWQKEHKQIQEAAAKFGLWMKANSILPYNDATIAYLNILIEAEQAKVDAGGMGNRKVLADLEEDKRKHQELVAVLTESMKDTGKFQRIDQGKIQRIIQSLYNLKHFGKNLEQLKIDITEAHAETNRELPHFVKIKHTSRSSNSLCPKLPMTGYGQAQSHPRSASYQSTHQLVLRSAPSPTYAQTQQVMRPGFASGTMRTGPNGASALMTMPGAFSSELPSQNSQSSYVSRKTSATKHSTPGRYSRKIGRSATATNPVRRNHNSGPAL
jgi:GTPase SAR1 family protein